MKRIIALIVFVCTIVVTNAQTTPKIPAGSTLASYCEYGSKGVKLGVIAFTDKSFRRFTVIESKELNIALSKVMQSTKIIPTKDINSAVQSSTDEFKTLNDKYKDKGLKDGNTFYYTSSGLAIATNIQELCDSVKSKTGRGVYIVKVTEESQYTVAGTVPYDKISKAIVLDQGGGNTKGGLVIVNNNSLTVSTISFDLGSVTLADLITKSYMSSRPDDKDEERRLFIDGMNRCIDSLKDDIKTTFENIEGAQNRNELYLSGGAAYVITTLLYPEADQTEQMVEVNYDKLRAFLTDVQDKDYYKKVREKTFINEVQQKNYTKSISIYTHLQLISATKLLLTYINAISADDKKIYFNTYGLHAMPSMLLGRVLRGDIPRW